MEFREIISEISKSFEIHDLVSVRELVEDNLELLNKNKHRLNGKIKNVFDFFTNQSDFLPLNRSDVAVINTINHYASNFDVRGIRIVLKDHITLLFRDDSIQFLSSDAKIILESMNVIPKKRKN